MDDESKSVDEPQVVPPATEEKKVEEPVVDEAKKELEDKLNKEIEARKQITARAKKSEEREKALEEQLKNSTKTLDVEDYIDISASLEGLDQKEKEKLAREHKLTGKPLSEIRKDEDFLLWQSAYRQKVEKEKALSPSNTQSVVDKPKTLAEKLNSTNSLEEKEKLLAEAGLWKSPRPKADRKKFGL